jgi:hypothetical protein
MTDNLTHHEPPIEYPAAPNVLQAAKDYDPGDADKTMMTVRRFPVFLRQGLEALSRERDGGGSMERTVGAMLELGLPILRRFPGVAECQDARQALLLRSRDPYVRLWLQQIVPIDVRTARLGDIRFGVRVPVGLHRQIGQLAAVLGLYIGQGFTVALTAALIGSSYLPMDEAHQAMYETLTELRDRCQARARHAGTLQIGLPTAAAQPRWTIHDVLGG